MAGGAGAAGRLKAGRGDEGVAGAVLNQPDMGGDGLGEGLRGLLKGLEEPDEPVAIGLDGGDVVIGVTEDGFVVGEFVPVVAQPENLVANAVRIITVGGGHGILGVMRVDGRGFAFRVSGFGVGRLKRDISRFCG